METIGDWVKNLVYYMILLSVLGNLMAASSYEKYIRFFAGLLLILLVLQPLTGRLGLDGMVQELYRQLTLQAQTQELKEDLLGMEEKSRSQVIRQYEKAVAEDVRQMVCQAGADGQAEVSIEENRESPSYGRVTEIRLLLKRPPAADWTAEAGAAVSPVRIEKTQVAPVQIGADKEMGGEPEPPARDDVPEQNNETGNIRRKVAQYYELEEAHVKIQWEDDPGKMAVSSGTGSASYDSGGSGSRQEENTGDGERHGTEGRSALAGGNGG